jgi:cell division protein FtsZ
MQAPQARPASVPSIAPAMPQPQQRIEKDGVNIEPLQPAAMFTDEAIEDEFRAALEVELAPPADEFIPPAPEMPEPSFATTRMPDVQDFPPMVQAELEKRAAARHQHEERGGSMGGLLKKLAHNFGVRDEEVEQPRAAARPQARMEPQAPQVRPVQNAAPAGHGRVDDNPFAPKRAGLDRHGRITPGEKAMNDDDQLEIPAFLRRQSS